MRLLHTEKRGDILLDLLKEEKKLFYKSGVFKDYIIKFEDIGLEITNEILHQESVVIKESIMESEEFVLGGCIASSLEFEVSEILEDDINGVNAIVTLMLSEGEVSIPMGVYRVNSAEKVDDRDYKRVTAYDALYDASVDVSGWYNNLFPVIKVEEVTKKDECGNDVLEKVTKYGKVTLKEMRESLLAYLEIPYEVQELTNDELEIEKTLDVGNGKLIGTDILKKICTINGGFGKIDRNGIFKVINLKENGLYPSENLYPSEDLYPIESSECIEIETDNFDSPCYRSVKYEEYITRKISCITIKTNEDDYGCTIGDSTENPYIISENFLLYGMDSKTLERIGANIFETIKGISYRPCTVLMDGLPYMESGDTFLLNKQRDIVESYFFSRTLTGVQNLQDNIVAKGEEIRTNEISKSAEIEQLKGKILNINKTVDAIKVVMSDIEKKAESEIEQTASQIVLKVDNDGNIVKVMLGSDPDDNNAVAFCVTSNNIKLTADDIINIIAGNTLNLTGEKIKIASENFNVDENGKVEAKAINITGGSVDVETDYKSESGIKFNYRQDDGKYIEVSVNKNGFIQKKYEKMSYNSHGNVFDYENVEESAIGDGMIKLQREYGEILASTVKQMYGELNLSIKFALYADNSYFPFVNTTLPIKAPNINKYKKVTVSTTEEVSPGYSSNVEYTFDEMEGATGYEAVLQSVDSCIVHSVKIEGTTLTANLVNIIGVKRSLTATFLILPTMEMEVEE